MKTRSFSVLLRKSSTSSIRTRNWGYLKARLEDNGEKILLLIFYFILAFWKSDNFSSVCITAYKHKKKTIDVLLGLNIHRADDVSIWIISMGNSMVSSAILKHARLSFSKDYMHSCPTAYTSLTECST